MKKRSAIAFGMLCLLAFTSCGEDKFTYSYNVNGCETGEHTFDTKDAYCKGLQDNTLNKGCALATRESTFKNECPGTFTSVN